MNRTLLGALLGAASVIVTSVDAGAQVAAEGGKPLRIIVGYAAGTEYDQWGRLLSRHIGRHLPGNPGVIVENMPGAGSLKAANYLFAQAPKDGTVIGAIGRDVITLPLVNSNAGSRFEAAKFGWLGSPTTETNVCAANAAAGLKTAADLFVKELIVGGTGAGTGTSIYPRVLNALLGTKLKLTDGYKSSTEVLLAMDRHEVEGICQSYSYIRQVQGQQIDSGKVVILLQGGGKPDPRLPGITFAPELAKTPEQRQGLEFLYGPQAYARPFTAPAGLPENVLKPLQNAFAATLRDSKFIAEAKMMKLELNPVNSDEMVTLVSRAYATPQAVIDHLESILKVR